MIRLSRERLNIALSKMSQAEQDELLTLLEQERVAVQSEAERWTELEATRTPIESFMPLGAPEYVASRPVSWPAGQRPPLAEFIASFAPAMPPAPPKSTPATVSSVPDVPVRVPLQRRPRLLQEVIERTQQENARRQMERLPDEDKLGMYRRGPVDMDGPGYTDE
jgi:hypothetical protein